MKIKASIRREFNSLNIYYICPASSMDRISDYGSFDERSNRSWGTKTYYKLGDAGSGPAYVYSKGCR